MKETRFRDVVSKSYLKDRDFWHESLKDNKDGDILFSVSIRHDFNPNDIGVAVRLLSDNKARVLSLTHARLLADGFELDTEISVDIELTKKLDDTEVFYQTVYVFEKIPERDVDRLRKNIMFEIDYVLDGILKTKVIQIERYQYFPVPL